MPPQTGKGMRLMHGMPHIKKLFPPPLDSFGFKLPRSNMILKCYRRVPPGAWDIDVVNLKTMITTKNCYTNLSGDECYMILRLLIAVANRFGMW